MPGSTQPTGSAGSPGICSPGGVFTLWSNDPPDPEFVASLLGAFADVTSTVVSFPNPLQESDATNTVYVARKVL